MSLFVSIDELEEQKQVYESWIQRIGGIEKIPKFFIDIFHSNLDLFDIIYICTFFHCNDVSFTKMINILRHIRENKLNFIQYVKLKEFFRHLTSSAYAQNIYVSYNLRYMHVTDMLGNISYEYFDLDKDNICLNNFCFV